jgi:16S rRNA (cytidine1402-2'-O)-methyltransferase
MTLLIGKGAGQQTKAKDIAQRLEEIMREQKLDENAALKILAKEQGISKSEAYRELQRLRRKK